MLSSRPDVLARIEAALVGWLTTVSPTGQPQASPVWHVVERNELLVYSRRGATRLTNLEHNPKVAYNLRGDERGDDIVTLEGTARVDPDLPPAIDSPAYVAKYQAEMERLGWSVERYAADFPVGIRIRINRVRAWS